ncbi:GLPGLI family protein [Chitinophaga solisilvae]|uniref:GLPGLI family protein n=1 Tax=Chitinophaga solisilvae TaxID=1233460 RepID=UPI00136B0DBB|nr:GLPGLI family protein [Chitinophaga solisilvae]
MKFFIYCILTIGYLTSNAQLLITSGKITFEKKVNLTRIAQEEGRFNTGSSQQSAFYTRNYELSFIENRSLYKPTAPATSGSINAWWQVAAENIVLTDFTSNLITIQKQIFEQSFLISDNILSTAWKVSTDSRVIAGVTCRKASCTVMDSLVVIAFYTDRIPISGGPESFAGLPGMIMGIAIPKLHTTWYATSVQNLGNQKEININLAEKNSKKISRDDLSLLVKQQFNNFGASSRKYQWQILL